VHKEQNLSARAFAVTLVNHGSFVISVVDARFGPLSGGIRMMAPARIRRETGFVNVNTRLRQGWHSFEEHELDAVLTRWDDGLRFEIDEAPWATSQTYTRLSGGRTTRERDGSIVEAAWSASRQKRHGGRNAFRHDLYS
jgi:hypothetical protein